MNGFVEKLEQKERAEDIRSAMRDGELTANLDRNAKVAVSHARNRIAGNPRGGNTPAQRNRFAAAVRDLTSQLRPQRRCIVNT